MTDGYTFNRVKFTANEETCILKFLNDARECGYPSANEQWYPVIDSIIQKFFNSNIKPINSFKLHDKIANQIFPREWKEICSNPVY